MAKKHTKPEPTHDPTSRDMQRDASHDVVTPADAAERLGVTADAVRARLRRGSLPGERVDGEWLVHLPPANHRAMSRRVSRDVRQMHDVDVASLLAAKDETIAAKDTALAALARDVDWLRDQLGARSRELAAERERSDVLHREALVRIDALTAGSEAEAASDAPQTAQDGSGATNAESPSNDNESREEATEPQKTGFAAWWGRIFGRLA